MLSVRRHQRPTSAMAGVGVAVSALVLLATSAGGAIIINYDTDTNGSGSLAGASFSNPTPTTGLSLRAFDEVNPWIVGGGYTGPTLFGGVRGESENTVTPPPGTNFGTYNASPFAIRYQRTGDDSGRLFMAGYFETPGLVPHFVDATSSIRMSGNSGGGMPRFDALGEVRWMLRDANGDYWVSNTLIANNTNGRELDGTELLAETWAAYDPNGSLIWNDTNPFSTTTATLNATGIEAFGWMVYKPNLTSVRHWLQFNEFVVDAQPIPEPATAALLLIGAGVLVRRRRS